jgi:hypothetical protein
MPICDPCKQAGELNQLANQQREGQRGFSGDILTGFAKKKHEECPGYKQCDCQHFIGQALNLTMLRGVTDVQLPSSEEPPEVIATSDAEHSTNETALADPGTDVPDSG